jgi:hypothetical protein
MTTFLRQIAVLVGANLTLKAPLQRPGGKVGRAAWIGDAVSSSIAAGAGHVAQFFEREFGGGFNRRARPTGPTARIEVGVMSMKGMLLSKIELAA